MKKYHHLLPDTVLTVYCLEGVVTEQIDFPESFIGNWEEDGYSFLFFLEPDDCYIEKLLKENHDLKQQDRLTMTYRDWQGGSIEPVKVGRFILNPPWIKAAPGQNEIALTLDPGVVFGNGTHPTTLACMKAIEIACLGGKVDTMLDLGTGTGLLALLAAKCGCGRIVAVDNNMLAARTARRNVELNGLSGKIAVVNGMAQDFTVNPSDLLVANIQYEVMRKIVSSPGFSKQKWFVLSGLKKGEAEAILESLKEKPVIILKRWESGGGVWHTVLGITESAD